MKGDGVKMAEEDLIFGKNRHMFGGIEPSNIKFFKARLKSDGKVNIEITLPSDTVIDGQTLCTVAGAVIRRKTTGYPVDEFDGVEAMIVSASGTYVDSTADVGTNYYYAAFPFTTQGVYNRSTSGRTIYTGGNANYIFGYDLDTSDSNPSTRVTYPSDVDNANFTPAGMNYSSTVFNYGDWPNTAGEKFMPAPCMLGYDGKVKYYLNPNDYTKREDGNDSDIASTSFAGNAMMEWPKIYTKREEVDGVYKFRCSNEPHGDGWECWCNYDKNNNVIDYFYTAIYHGAGQELTDSTHQLRSISGYTPHSELDTEVSVGEATKNGADWYIEVLADYLLIQDLLVMMAKTTDCQTAYGYGLKTGSASGVLGGSMNDKGLFWGTNSYTSGGVKIFGMEHWWGYHGRRLAGWINYYGKWYVKLTRGTKDGSTATDYGFDQDGYIGLDAAASPSGGNGYISKLTTYSWGRIPSKIAGSSSTYECDFLHMLTQAGYYAYVCQSYYEPNSANDMEHSGGTKMGPFNVDLSIKVTDNLRGGGASLSCKPSV